MTFWEAFEKRAEEVSEAAQFSSGAIPIAVRTTSFGQEQGIPSKHRGNDHIKYEDNYSTTGAFGY